MGEGCPDPQHQQTCAHLLPSVDAIVWRDEGKLEVEDQSGAGDGLEAEQGSTGSIRAGCRAGGLDGSSPPPKSATPVNLKDQSEKLDARMTNRTSLARLQKETSS